jgi:hypothetical protein
MADIVTPPAAGDAANIGGNDPTLVSGQNPKDLFGVSISYDTGAPGTAGASAQPQGDPTNEPGQYPATEPISGVDLSGGSGAPGSAGADPADRPGETSVTITDPNYTAGRPGGGSGNVFIQAPVAVGGPGDSTTVPGQYASGVANAMPGLAEPQGTGAGRGRVLRGGWANGKR